MVRTRYILYLLFILSMTSCLKEMGYEEPPVTGEEEWMEASLQIYTSPSTYAMTGKMENHIETIDVIAFKIQGNYSYYAFRSIGQITGTPVAGVTKVIAKLKKDDFEYQLAILANSRTAIDQVAGSFSFSQTKENILNLILSENSEKWAATGEYFYDPIPMWGESGKVKIEEDTEINNIGLLRALARVDVTVSTAAQEDFRLKEVHLYNRNTKGNIVPSSKTWDQIPFSSRVVAPTIPSSSNKIQAGLKYVTDSDTEFTSTLYTYEAEGVDIGADPEATCLVLGGEYGDENKTTYYRVDFKGKLESGDAISDENHYDAILRNHLYDLTINSVSKSGFSTADSAFYYKDEGMTVSIQTWNMQDVESELDGNYNLKVSKGAFYLSNQGVNNQVISISSNHPLGWSMQVTDSWINATRVDDNTITFNVSSYIPQRIGYIDIKAGNLTKRIKIQQN